MIGKRPSGRVSGGIFMFSGIVCGIIAVVAAFYCWNFIRTAIKTEGRVVQMKARNGENGPTYAPVFSFQDNRGEEHTVLSSASSRPPAHQVGDKVRVLYAPDDPGKAKIEGFFSLWGLPAITGLIGLIHFSVGLVIQRRSLE